MIKVNIDCAYDELVSIKKMKPHPRNANKHSHEQIVRLAEIIEYQGMRSPIVVSNLSGYITKGHGRLAALKRLGVEKVPVNFQDYADEAQEFTDLVADNEIARWAELEMDKIIESASVLDGVDLDLLGIKDLDIPDLEEILGNERSTPKGPVDDEEEVPVVKSKSKVKKGDVWLLGKHRLMCGDSTNREDVLKMMNGEKADLIVTDPPYNVAYEGKTKEKLTIQNDSMDDQGFYQFLKDVYDNLYAITNDGGGIYVFHADSEGANFRLAMINAKWKLAQCCIWVKNSMVMGRQDYHWQHEPVLVGWKPTAAHKWYSDRKQTTVWNFNRPSRNAEHPTMKPIDLICYPIGNASKKNDIVVDLFLGSGSTLIAADKMQRVCYGMELDENYCEVIIKRWENATGLKATNEKTGRIYEETRK